MNNDTLDFTDVSDQVVEPEYRNNLVDFDKVPDIVKSIREFSGNPAEFGSWKSWKSYPICGYSKVLWYASYHKK